MCNSLVFSENSSHKYENKSTFKWPAQTLEYYELFLYF